MAPKASMSIVKLGRFNSALRNKYIMHTHDISFSYVVHLKHANIYLFEIMLHLSDAIYACYIQTFSTHNVDRWRYNKIPAIPSLRYSTESVELRILIRSLLRLKIIH